MKKENDIIAELKEWGSPLADMSRAMPYHLPEDYFEKEVVSVAHCKAAEIKVEFDKELPFSVPDGYFDAFPQNILVLAKGEVFNEMMPKDAPFAVPAGYFETLPAEMLAQAKQNASPKKIIFRPEQWMRRAVAAMLLLAIGIGGFQYVERKHTTLTPEKQLAKVSQSWINEYVHQNLNNMDADQVTPGNADMSIVIATQQLDRNDIDQYLDETGLKTEYNIN